MNNYLHHSPFFFGIAAVFIAGFWLASFKIYLSFTVPLPGRLLEFLSTWYSKVLLYLLVSCLSLMVGFLGVNVVVDYLRPV